MAYLIDHPPAIAQYRKRSRRLTGLTVLHTAESVMDSVGPDTGAEGVAEFIRTRTTYGSYHDVVDSDTCVPLVPYELAAFQDGTGSNEFALSLSFACRTSDWRAMSPEQRAGFLRQGARAFARQQAWRAARGFPLTELRYITKAQSDAGLSGFIEHGRRDPARRSDPGVVAPDLFPHDEWLDACRAALAGTDTEEDELMTAKDDILHAIDGLRAEVDTVKARALQGRPCILVQDDVAGSRTQGHIWLVGADGAKLCKSADDARAMQEIGAAGEIQYVKDAAKLDSVARLLGVTSS